VYQPHNEKYCVVSVFQATFLTYYTAIIFSGLFGDYETAQRILSSDHPKDHQALGRCVANFDSKLWKSNCRRIVKEGNLAKVSDKTFGFFTYFTLILF